MYDFSELRTLSAFITAAAEADLFVILRIGPYVCSESVAPHHYLLAEPCKFFFNNKKKLLFLFVIRKLGLQQNAL